jgi:hypothetical protein
MSIHCSFPATVVNTLHAYTDGFHTQTLFIFLHRIQNDEESGG